jgi:hypothetical protein
MSVFSSIFFITNLAKALATRESWIRVTVWPFRYLPAIILKRKIGWRWGFGAVGGNGEEWSIEPVYRTYSVPQSHSQRTLRLNK